MDILMIKDIDSLEIQQGLTGLALQSASFRVAEVTLKLCLDFSKTLLLLN